jgi:DNA-directed RNA polymerase specialized sigma24 family protein
MEDAIVRMADLEDEINRDIMNLVELKQAIVRLIRHVGIPDQQTILELRYISFWAWERIAADLNYSLRQTHRLHSAALDSCDAIMRRDGRYAKMAHDVMECHA